jgi:hypothetical protein
MQPIGRRRSFEAVCIQWLCLANCLRGSEPGRPLSSRLTSGSRRSFLLVEVSSTGSPPMSLWGECLTFVTVIGLSSIGLKACCQSASHWIGYDQQLRLSGTPPLSEAPAHWCLCNRHDEQTRVVQILTLTLTSCSSARREQHRLFPCRACSAVVVAHASLRTEPAGGTSDTIVTLACEVLLLWHWVLLYSSIVSTRMRIIVENRARRRI